MNNIFKTISKPLKASGFLLGIAMLILHYGLKLDISGFSGILYFTELIALTMLYLSRLAFRLDLIGKKDTVSIVNLYLPLLPVLLLLVILLFGIISRSSFLAGCEFYLAIILVFQLIVFSFKSGGNFEQPTQALLVSFVGTDNWWVSNSYAAWDA